jgi:hypothetical protein
MVKVRSGNGSTMRGVRRNRSRSKRRKRSRAGEEVG